MTTAGSRAIGYGRRTILLVMACFLALSGVAVWHHGYWGIVEDQFGTWAGAQVFVDLVLALAMVLTWLRRDARKHGRRYWPWLVFTLAAGSVGPLCYVLFHKR